MALGPGDRERTAGLTPLPTTGWPRRPSEMPGSPSRDSIPSRLTPRAPEGPPAKLPDNRTRQATTGVDDEPRSSRIDRSGKPIVVRG